jgi:hippurate hydrolase
MPVVTVKDEFTPSTFNPPAFAEKMGGLLTAHFGAARVTKAPAVMGGEDFGRFWRADNSIGSFIFWVGGVPADRMAKAAKGEITLPSLHSPFWAPEADKVIPTAAEAMTVLAMDLLKKK